LSNRIEEGWQEQCAKFPKIYHAELYFRMMHTLHYSYFTHTWG